jgi:transcriptional regulator with XRE-family HTH domain
MSIACHRRDVTRMSAARSRFERRGARRARELRGLIASDIRRVREDAGLSQRGLARAAGISNSTLAALERGVHDPTTEVLARIAAVLGMDLAMRLYPGTGPLIRDHSQAAMIEALLGMLHPRWRPTPEVWVTRPVKGVIDLVLEPELQTEPLVSVEAQSELRRLEQQIRWAHAKSQALSETRGRSASPLLLLRSTRNTRAIVADHAATVRAAYPAPSADAHAALTGTARWPGAAVVWCDMEQGKARLREAPPRGITLGR